MLQQYGFQTQHSTELDIVKFIMRAIDDSKTVRTQIKTGIPQGYVLGPMFLWKLYE